MKSTPSGIVSVFISTFLFPPAFAQQRIDSGGELPPLASVTVATGYNLVPVTPCRILDTRVGTGDFAGLRVSGSTTDVGSDPFDRLLQGGTNFCPGFDTGLYYLNSQLPRHPAAIAYTLTVVDYTGNGFVTVFPSSTDRPLASTINFGPGTAPTPVASGSIVGTCTSCVGGEVSLYVEGASANLIVDVVGYYDRGFVGNSSGAPLSETSALAGDNFMISVDSVAPLRTLTCVVTADLTWVNNGSNTTGVGTLSTAQRTNDGSLSPPEADPGWQNHVGGNGASRGSASKTAVWTLPARATGGHLGALVTYSFGCNFVASGDFVGDSVYCTITWSCR
jgi:hypothetical protein